MPKYFEYDDNEHSYLKKQIKERIGRCLKSIN